MKIYFINMKLYISKTWNRIEINLFQYFIYLFIHF